MRGVILAAGDGGRLRPYTDRTPKVLILLKGRPLIWYPMVAMARAGITEIGVVVGHLAEQVMNGVMEWAPPGVRIKYVYNPEYEGGNAVSVRAAREFVGREDFVLSMGDHIIASGIASRLAASPSHAAVLGVDSAASMAGQLSDATKVFVDDDGLLVRIGKGLRRWNAVDIGVFKFQPSVFETFDRLYDEDGEGLELTRVMQHLAQQHRVQTCDIKGRFWSDIDTIEDYRSTDDYIELVPGSLVA